MSKNQNYNLIYIIFFAQVLSANACDKDDINYYLEKGFSHDQVTKLCSHQMQKLKKNK